VAEPAVDTALIAEATRKAGLVWLTYGGHDRALPAWHVWLDGAAYVVSGGGEQPLPGIDTVTEALVTVPSKDNRARLTAWTARVTTLRPGDDVWPAATAALAAARLNARDIPNQVARWVDESVVTALTPTALTPTGPIVERPDSPSDDAHRAPPPVTPATTLGRQPFMIGGVPRSRSRGA
jgi:hypothetical protein